MRAPVRYRVKKSDQGTDYHYVAVGGNGEVMSTGENVDTPSKAEARAGDAWIAHVRSVLDLLGHVNASAGYDHLLAAFPVPFTRDSIRAKHRPA